MVEVSRKIKKVEGRAIPVRGDDIDTDRIMPARYLRCVTFDGLGEHVFEDDRRSFPGGTHPVDRPAHHGASILVVNRNFGCGSSREHAPQGLWRWGIRGIVGESFAEIFFGNCVALGLPCVVVSPAEVARLQERSEREPQTVVTLDLEQRVVRVEGHETFPAQVPDGVRRAFLSGTWDPTALLMDGAGEIDRVAAQLPYVSRWPSPASSRGRA